MGGLADNTGPPDGIRAAASGFKPDCARSAPAVAARLDGVAREAAGNSLSPAAAGVIPWGSGSTGAMELGLSSDGDWRTGGEYQDGAGAGTRTVVPATGEKCSSAIRLCAICLRRLSSAAAVVAAAALPPPGCSSSGDEQADSPASSLLPSTDGDDNVDAGRQDEE